MFAGRGVNEGEMERAPQDIKEHTNVLNRTYLSLPLQIIQHNPCNCLQDTAMMNLTMTLGKGKRVEALPFPSL